MPQVPTLDNFSVGLNGGSSAHAVATPAVNSAPEQLQRAGAAVQGASSAAGQIVQDVQMRANQVRVDDAINQAKERAMQLTFSPDEGFTTLKGDAALNRPNGQSLDQEYGTKLQTSIDQIAGTLGNTPQRQAFSAAAAQMRTNFSSDIMRHENNEFRDYTLSVREGTIATSQNEIGLKYSDPEAVNRNILSIQAAVYDQAKLLGKSATWAEAQARNMTSNAHRVAMSAALENNDIGFVESYLKAHGAELNADDALAINGAVTKQKGMTYATDVASSVFSGVSVGGAAPETLRMPVQGTVTSGFGHRVAPIAGASTEHDGIDIAAPEGAKVGAAAAGRVVYAGQKSGYGNYVEVQHADGSHTFYGHLSSIAVQKGAEVRGGDSLGAVGSTGVSTGPHLHWGMRDAAGKPVDPRSIRAVGGSPGVGANASLLDMVQAVRADPRLEGHPEWQAEAERQVRSLYSAREEAVSKADEAATGNAMRTLVANGGKMTPQLAASVPDRALPTVMSFANSMEAAQRRDDNEGDPILWGALKSQIASGNITKPEQIIQYAPRLSKNDYRDLTNDVISIQSGDQKKIDSYGTVDRTLKYVHSEMLSAGLDWTPDNKDPDAAAKFGAFQTKLLRNIATLEQTQGKPLTQDESRKVALSLLAEVPHTGGWMSSPKRGYQLANGALPLASIPFAVQQRAAAALRANGKPVTEANLRRVIANPDMDLSK